MRDIKPLVSIMRWINYQDAGMDRLERSVQYVFNSKSSPLEYRGSYNLPVSNPIRGMEIIQNRKKSRGTRIFKHGVISFGVRNLAAKKAMEVTSEILEIYKLYPIIYAIHTNIPNRIHAHFIMGMVNISSGKKFEQDQAEFDRFRDHYNKTLVKNNLPPLKGFQPENETSLDMEDEVEYWQSPQTNNVRTMQFYEPIISPGTEQYVNFNLNRIVDRYANDFKVFYNFGRSDFNVK